MAVRIAEFAVSNSAAESKVLGQFATPDAKSSIGVQSPRLKTQQLFAINRAELSFIDGQRFATEV